jgi:hypothetical protein
MDPQEKVDAFVSELRALVEKHYGAVDPAEAEPFGMRLRKVLPMVAAGGGSVTTTATISLPLDTDPPDQDD